MQLCCGGTCIVEVLDVDRSLVGDLLTCELLSLDLDVSIIGLEGERLLGDTWVDLSPPLPSIVLLIVETGFEAVNCRLEILDFDALDDMLVFVAFGPLLAGAICIRIQLKFELHRFMCL